MKEMSGVPAARIVRAFAVADGAFGLTRLKERIDALDLKIDADLQTGLYADIATLLSRLGLWFTTNVSAKADLGEAAAMFKHGVEKLRGTFSTLVSPYDAQNTEARIAELEAGGVPHALAEDLGVLQLMAATPEIALLAHDEKLDLDLVAGAFFAVGSAVGIDKLHGLAERIGAAEHWDRLAIRRLGDDLYAGQRALAAAALKLLPAERAKDGRAAGAEAVKLWTHAHDDALARAKAFFAALEASGELSVAKLTLADNQLHELAGR
jgi:glutamate dehydrogenase